MISQQSLMLTKEDAFLLLLYGELLHQPEVLLLVVAEPLHCGHEGEPDEDVEEGREPVTLGGSEQSNVATATLAGSFPLTFHFSWPPG